MIPIVGRSCQIVGRPSGLTCSHCQTTSRLQKNTSQPTNLLLKNLQLSTLWWCFFGSTTQDAHISGLVVDVCIRLSNKLAFSILPNWAAQFFGVGMLPFSTWVVNRVFTFISFSYTYSSPQSPTSFWEIVGLEVPGEWSFLQLWLWRSNQKMCWTCGKTASEWHDLSQQPLQILLDKLDLKPEVIFRTPRAFPYVQALH